jgi:hypothetical protein
VALSAPLDCRAQASNSTSRVIARSSVIGSKSMRPGDLHAGHDAAFPTHAEAEVAVRIGPSVERI